MAVLITAVRALGIYGVVIASLLVFYEGIPGANYLTPYLRIIPAAGPMVDDLAQGRVGRAREAGRIDERLAWQEIERRAELKREQARRAAQEKIDQVEREYLARQTDDAVRISDLEKALENEQTNSPSAGCGPAVSRRLRDAINRVGRD